MALSLPSLLRSLALSAVLLLGACASEPEATSGGPPSPATTPNYPDAFWGYYGPYPWYGPGYGPWGPYDWYGWPYPYYYPPYPIYPVVPPPVVKPPPAKPPLRPPVRKPPTPPPRLPRSIPHPPPSGQQRPQ